MALQQFMICKSISFTELRDSAVGIWDLMDLLEKEAIEELYQALYVKGICPPAVEAHQWVNLDWQRHREFENRFVLRAVAYGDPEDESTQLSEVPSYHPYFRFLCSSQNIEYPSTVHHFARREDGSYEPVLWDGVSRRG